MRPSLAAANSNATVETNADAAVRRYSMWWTLRHLSTVRQWRAVRRCAESNRPMHAECFDRRVRLYAGHTSHSTTNADAKSAMLRIEVWRRVFPGAELSSRCRLCRVRDSWRMSSGRGRCV